MKNEHQSGQNMNGARRKHAAVLKSERRKLLLLRVEQPCFLEGFLLELRTLSALLTWSGSDN